MEPKFLEFMNEYLSFVAEQLCKYAAFIKSPGLMNGKTGIAVFLYRYARITGNERYTLYADDLLDDIYKEISSLRLSLNFENGISGIVAGMNCLVEQGLVEKESEDIFEDIDALVVEHQAPDKTMAFSMLLSIASYWLQRRDMVRLHDTLSRLSQLFLKTITEIDDFHKANPLQEWKYNTTLCEWALAFLAVCTVSGYYDNNVEFLCNWFQNPVDSKFIVYNRWCYRQIYNEICQKNGIKNTINIERDETAYNETYPDKATLQDLLILRDYQLKYKFHLPYKADEKIKEIIQNKALTDEFKKLPTIQTLDISHNFTGLAWILLDYMEKSFEDTKG